MDDDLVKMEPLMIEWGEKEQKEAERLYQELLAQIKALPDPEGLFDLLK